MSSSAGEYQPEASTNSTASRAKRRKTAERSGRSDDYLNPEDSSLSYRTTSHSTVDTMHRTSITPTKELKFTKTGRVSKATKGERVHACDECGKVYTRAEHLRRHKKNHSPGTLPCDVPGCGRSFFREDLLQRHKQRHNDPDASPFRRASTDGHLSGSDSFTYRGETVVSETLVPGNTITGRLPPEDGSMTMPSAGKPYHPRPFHDLPLPPKVPNHPGYRPLDELPRRHASITNVAPFGAPLSGAPWRRNSSPLRNTSPNQPYYDHVGDAHYDPYHYPKASRSPTSADSALLPLSTVGEEHMQQTFGTISTPSSDISAGPAVTGQFNIFDNNHTRVSSISPHMTSPEERDLLEQMDLKTPTMGRQTAEFGPNMSLSVYDTEEQYLNAYWQAIHPLWPVVHRPSFDTMTASPLLKAAMISLGAQSIGDANDFSNARILHERCLKVLRKRTNSNGHSYRLCDMQAVILVELYAVYKSRRPPLQPSLCFEDVSQRIANDLESYPTTAPESFAAMTNYADVLSGMTPEVHREAKRRLLVACYILDRQHSMFFGRKPTDCLTISMEYLPFPQPFDTWDSTTEASVNTAYGNYTGNQQTHSFTYEALNAISTLSQPSTSPYDAFRSSYLIAGLKYAAEGQIVSNWKPVDDTEASALLYVVDHSPRTLMAYHMFMLAKNTPIRDLLAVAGETWVMAEKISSQHEYSAAQLEAGSWARNNNDGSDHSNALYHALQILSIHRDSSTPGLLYRDWAVYIATLVVWITSYVTQDSASRQRISAAATTITQQDLDRAVSAVIDAGPLMPISWANVSCLLLWTQSKLQQTNAPHNCGLTNGCLDVLGKLISRGHENTWLR